MKYSEVEIMGPSFDQKEFGGEPKKIFICSTGRSGSWMLCRYMINNGLGIPGEYFNGNHMNSIARRLGVERPEDIEWKSRGRIRRWIAKRKGHDPRIGFLERYISALMEHRVYNGIFSAKILRNQYNDLPIKYKNSNFFSNSTFVYLYRKDLLSQAISLHISSQSGRWDFTDDVLTHAPDVARYANYAEIERRVYEIAIQNAEWTAFFVTRGIDPIAIEYREFLEDPNKFLLKISERAKINSSLLPLTYREENSRSPTPPGAPSKEDLVNGFRSRNSGLGL